MSSSLKRKSLSKPTAGTPVPAYDLAFVRGRNKNKAHSFLLHCFEESGVSKAELAHMLSKRPEQITRWLGGPGNLTLDTLSDLLFALKGEFFEVKSVDVLSRGKSNRCLHEWWSEKGNDRIFEVSTVEREKASREPREHRSKTKTFGTSAKKGMKYEQIAGV